MLLFYATHPCGTYTLNPKRGSLRPKSGAIKQVMRGKKEEKNGTDGLVFNVRQKEEH